MGYITRDLRTQEHMVWDQIEGVHFTNRISRERRLHLVPLEADLRAKGLTAAANDVKKAIKRLEKAQEKIR